MDKQNQLEYLNNVKEDLNAIGPGFCVLKWYHQEINLAEGQNHSCYHCPQHKIPLKGDLHNTPHKVEQRKIMLEHLKYLSIVIKIMNRLILYLV